MQDFENILEKGIEVVIPDRLIRETLRPAPNGIQVAENVYVYSGKLNVFGFGKAATGLVKQAVKILGQRIDNVVCCTPQPTEKEMADFPELFDDSDMVHKGLSKPKIHIYHGPRTNEPNEAVIRSSIKMAQIASNMKEEDLLLVCITGGGSAMLALPFPLDESHSPLQENVNRISLKSIIETSKLLSLDGASIQEINSVRSCLDAMKVGGLARFAMPAQVVSLILSDVIGDPLEFIASGPTYARETALSTAQPSRGCGGGDVSPIANALAVLEKYRLLEMVPQEVKKFFQARKKSTAKMIPLNPKPINLIIGNITMALKTAATHAASLKPRQVESETLPADIFRRTPVQSFQSILPIILVDTMDGDMGAKADAIADLAFALRGLLQFFLRNPSFQTRHVDSAVRERIKDAQKRIIGKMEYYHDLVHGCHKVAQIVLSNSSANEGDFLGGLCLLMGGEATVKVRPPPACLSTTKPVNGGRCSHAVLTAALRWYNLQSADAYNRRLGSGSNRNVDIGFYARASDGLDGPSAFGGGAWSSLGMVNSAEGAEIAKEYLQRGDSYGFFVNTPMAKEKGHFVPARLTGTNVMDLFACMINVFA